MALTNAQAGFLKGLGLALMFALLSFFGDVANLNGVVGPAVASLLAALASSLESHLKAESGGEKGLFGAVSIKQ